MKILLSPAKTFRRQPLPDVPAGQTPQYMETTELLHEELKKLTVDQWQKQFKLSEKAALENRARMNQPQPGGRRAGRFSWGSIPQFPGRNLERGGLALLRGTPADFIRVLRLVKTAGFHSAVPAGSGR